MKENVACKNLHNISLRFSPGKSAGQKNGEKLANPDSPGKLALTWR